MGINYKIPDGYNIVRVNGRHFVEDANKNRWSVNASDWFSIEEGVVNLQSNKYCSDTVDCYDCFCVSRSEGLISKAFYRDGKSAVNQ